MSILRGYHTLADENSGCIVDIRKQKMVKDND